MDNLTPPIVQPPEIVSHYQVPSQKSKLFAKSRKKMTIIGGILGVLVVALVGGFFILGNQDSTDTRSQASAESAPKIDFSRQAESVQPVLDLIIDASQTEASTSLVTYYLAADVAVHTKSEVKGETITSCISVGGKCRIYSSLTKSTCLSGEIENGAYGCDQTSALCCLPSGGGTTPVSPKSSPLPPTPQPSPILSSPMPTPSPILVTNCLKSGGICRKSSGMLTVVSCSSGETQVSTLSCESADVVCCLPNPSPAPTSVPVTPRPSQLPTPMPSAIPAEDKIIAQNQDITVYIKKEFINLIGWSAFIESKGVDQYRLTFKGKANNYLDPVIQKSLHTRIAPIYIVFNRDINSMGNYSRSIQGFLAGGSPGVLIELTTLAASPTPIASVVPTTQPSASPIIGCRADTDCVAGQYCFKPAPECYGQVCTQQMPYCKLKVACSYGSTGQVICPQLAPVSPEFCKGGTIVAQVPDECGCAKPPTCQPGPSASASPTPIVGGTCSSIGGTCRTVSPTLAVEPCLSSEVKTSQRCQNPGTICCFPKERMVPTPSPMVTPRPTAVPTPIPSPVMVSPKVTPIPSVVPSPQLEEKEVTLKQVTQAKVAYDRAVTQRATWEKRVASTKAQIAKYSKTKGTYARLMLIYYQNLLKQQQRSLTNAINSEIAAEQKYLELKAIYERQHPQPQAAN